MNPNQNPIKETYKLFNQIVKDNPQLYIVTTETWEEILKKIAYLDRALKNAKSQNDVLRAKLSNPKPISFEGNTNPWKADEDAEKLSEVKE